MAGMTRQQLHDLTRTRLREASTLLRAGQYPGAYYIAGYAVECALKACIAKQTKRHDFPDKGVAAKAWVHDLKELARTAGVWPDLERDMKANKQLELNWSVVKDWNETSRYELGRTVFEARDFYSAITAREHGVLPWIRKRW